MGGSWATLTVVHIDGLSELSKLVSLGEQFGWLC